MQVMRILHGFCAVVALLCTTLNASPTIAQTMDKVRIAAQVWYPSFAMYAAQEAGIYKKWGIDPEFKVYPSGAPIAQAAATNEWDVAQIGAPPFMQAAAKLDLKAVGVISEEAVMHELIVRPDFYEVLKKDPSKIKGSKVFITTASTGHYMVEACMKKFGLSMSDIQVLPSEQPASLAAFMAGNGDMVQLWAPQSTVAREKGMKTLCDGVQAGLNIPSVWAVAPDFAKKRPDVAVRWLKATLEGAEWASQDRARTTAVYKKWDEFRGSQTSDNILAEEVTLAMGLWPLSQQSEKMKGKPGEKTPYVHRALNGIAEFFIRIGRWKEKPDISAMIDTSFLDKAAASASR